MTTDPVALVASRLQNVKANGNGTSGACPVPGCTYRLRVSRGDDGRALLACDGGHRADDVIGPLRLELRDLFVANGREGGRGRYTPPKQSEHQNGSHHDGLTVEQYAVAKRLDPTRLRACGVSDIYYQGRPAVRMAYRDPAGNDLAVRFRLHLEKGEDDGRFRWKRGSKAAPYGQDRLGIARARGYVAIVEGESDAHTLWHHGEPALGIPGAGCWRDDRDAQLLDGIEAVYVIREPDAGGDTLITRFAASPLRDRIRVVALGEYKDPSALHLADPEQFAARWEAALEAAVPLVDILAAQAKADADAAWAACQNLAREQDILSCAAETVAELGVAGETRAVKLVCLAIQSRLLPRPVSAAVKGPSSSGKSHTVEQVLRLFPDEACYVLTAMSDRALAYSEEPLRHRTLVIYEASGLSGDMASYLIRSLLSEGRLSYETVEKTADGLKARHIVREGPTNLVVTTTAASLHPENETRLISIPVTDTREQTRAVFYALANGHGPVPDLTRWHALQRWLAGGPCEVAIPFAETLAVLTPPTAVRMRRDFGAVLSLIRAHTLLHRASREIDAEGRVVATLDDYAAVRELVEPLISAGVKATVPATVRETVRAVETLLQAKMDPEATVSNAEVGRELSLDKATISGRVRAAIEDGYLVNRNSGRGRTAQLVLGEPMPEDTPILPEIETVRVLGVESRGITPPPPSKERGMTDAETKPMSREEPHE